MPDRPRAPAPTPRASSFLGTAMLGYGLVIALLGAGVIVATNRTHAVTASQLDEVRAVEEQIAAAERLRWRSELLVSSGRGYLLAGDPDFLAKLRGTEAGLRDDLAELDRQTRTPEGDALLAAIRQAIDEYGLTFEQLLELRSGPHQPAELVRRFEAELLPDRRRLELALGAFLAHRADAIVAVYDDAARERDRFAARVSWLIAALVVLAFGLAWGFARRLSVSYAEEQDALAAARAAIAARDDLLGMVAHDLRNPLAAIALKAAALRRSAGGDEVVSGHAATIEKVAGRMGHLIGSMLDVATIEAGRFTVTPERCEVGPLVRDAAEVLGTLANTREVSLELADASPGLSVVADRERILQVLSNLVDNALKFTPRDGTVRLSVEEGPEVVRFRVTDSGPGIPEADLPHLFERYWKSEAEGLKGTGLGLFIAKGIVEAHDGRIWAERGRAAGASFVFTLPRAPSGTASTPWPDVRQQQAPHRDA